MEVIQGRKVRKKVLNIVEINDEGLVYIRLDNGGKYLLNCTGCWRCGSNANCFGNSIDGNEPEVVCEFDFFDEVRCLFLLLVKDRVMKIVDWLSDRVHGKSRAQNVCDLFSYYYFLNQLFFSGFVVYVSRIMFEQGEDLRERREDEKN